MDAPYSLITQLQDVKDKAHPPIHLWNPDAVKDIDMEIRRDGTWFYMGTPIERQRMVWLFSSVLRREDDGHFYLVTPVEKCRIRVQDAPFTVVLMAVDGTGQDQSLTFTTNVAEEVTASARHPLRFEERPDSGNPAPYLLVREGLDALVTRNVYYQLAELLVAETVDAEEWLGVWSEGMFFQFVRTEQLV